MYKLLFIDEEKTTLDDFEDYVENFKTKIALEAVTSLPSSNMDDMVSRIIQINPDALITDYRLNEKRTDINYNVPFNGVELVEEFQSIRNYFPCFVLTAVDDEAVNNSDDVNIVYIKNILYNKEEGKAKAKFLDRVISQIEHYKSRIERARAEIVELIQLKQNGQANFQIESRIIELDNFLEKSVDATSSIPIEFKQFSNTQRLDNILEKVDLLIKRLDSNG